MRAPLTSLLCLGAWCLVSIPARAMAQQGDGVYGRLDSDVAVSAGLGAGAASGEGAGYALVAELRALYLGGAGLLLAPDLRPGGTSRLDLAVEVRPLFPLRFLLNGSSGREWLDLALESVGFELGTALLWRDEGLRVALLVGFGVSLPIVLPSSSSWSDGLYLRLGARHTRAGPHDQAGPDVPVADWLFLAALTLRGGLDLGIARRELRR